MKINAVVVTYNRKYMLGDCLNAILAQTVPVDKIFVIDQHSTDSTEEYLLEKDFLKHPLIDYRYMECNSGGAGGFHDGMKLAYENGADWIWVMDDDVIPEVNCLEELVRANNVVGDRTASFFASSIRTHDGGAVNVPKISRSQFMKYTDWYEYLESGLAQIVKATFVSLLINTEAVRKCGLPWAPFFIWGDDSEYTQRIIRGYGPAYMVGASKAIHRRARVKDLSIVRETDLDRIERYFYYYRNNLIGFWEYETPLYRFLCLGKLAYDFLAVLFKGKYKFRKMKVILKAFVNFAFGGYDRESFRNRMNI